ncbi:hypothetical protein A2Z23_01725 [Candidatus Curtissbacteria bacterium RBG_16_39_7]|uniref:Short-chain dehydrogenase n=1 Tax=Candidatus Curtissbacteria bacterium RBG_16_39_7 TaxID=1797707 RepID=A0A1F5G536_9BACT|nr:MAG: hypothetical protein A2Z23_01725 [Candidatus Curtissbacteria bacterium RBG_16_39_7]
MVKKVKKKTLSEKIAIVTGAGRGIGREISLGFAKAGAKLVIISRTKNELDRTAQEIKKIGQEVLAISADITKPAEVKKVIEKALNRFKKIDILVNNAGILGPIGPIEKNEEKKWEQTIQTNLLGTYYFLKAIIPIMKKQKSGKIINLSGGGSTSPRPFFSAYAASKAAIVRLTETVAEEVKKYNIQVNAIAPGPINTKLLYEVLDAGQEVAGDKEFEKAKLQKKTGGTPIEKAVQLAIFLASDASNDLTGRLISAIYDDWQNFTQKKISQIEKSDLYTLRRITKK